MNTGETFASIFRGFRSVLLGAAIAVISAPALAVPITYTFNGTGTGTVGATVFTNAAYTITLTGDTVAITGSGTFFNVVTGTMTIAGIGTATITAAIDVFDNQGSSAVGFQLSPGGNDQLDVSNAAFATYALATNLGPISGLVPFALNQFVALGSTLGPITMPSSSTVTFQAGGGSGPPAAVVPVPTLSEYGLLLLALLTGSMAALRLRSRLANRDEGDGS